MQRETKFYSDYEFLQTRQLHALTKNKLNLKIIYENNWNLLKAAECLCRMRKANLKRLLEILHPRNNMFKSKS